MRVAINGFGRIGRDVTRIIFEQEVKEFELVAINIPSDLKTNAHLFKYDSLYGKFNGTVEVEEGKKSVQHVEKKKEADKKEEEKK